MLREVEKTGRLSLGQFYWRRFLRIVPVYFAYLVVLGVLQAWGRTHLDERAWLALGTYTVNFMTTARPHAIAHVWSLSVEEHFYVVWPLLMAFWTPGRCRNAALASVVSALGLRWLGPLAFPDSIYAPQWPFWTFTRMDDIAVGCLLAFLARDAAWRRRLDWFVADGRRLALTATAFLASQLLVSHQVGGSLLPPVSLKLLRGLANDVNTVGMAVMLWAVLVRPGGAAGRVLNYPLVRGVGVISYSLYLWHPLFCGNDSDWLCRFPQNLVPMFVAACLSYFLIEKPFLSLKARVGRPAPVAAPQAGPGRNKKAALTVSGGGRPCASGAPATS